MNGNDPNRATQILAALGKAIAYLALYLGSQILVSAGFSIWATLAVIMETGSVDLLQILEKVLACTNLISLISNLASLVFLLLFFLLRGKNPLREFQLHPVPPLAAAGAFSLAPLLYAAVTLVLSLLPAAWMADYIQVSSSLDETGLLPFLAIVLAAPAAEEVVFRGLIQSRLARALPGWAAVVLASLIFGLCHGQAVWVGYAFLIGMVLGLMTWRTGSILPSILTHFTFNAIGQILSLPQFEQVDGLAVLAVLAFAGAIACLLTRKGLAQLFLPFSAKESDANV